MKIRFISLKLLPGLLCFLIICAVRTAAQDTPVLINLAYSDTENYPFQMGNTLEMADPPGVTVEIIREAAENLGLTVRFFRYPSKRLFSYLQKGEIDGAFCFSYTPERLEYGRFPMRNGSPDSSCRLTTVSYYIYRRKDSDLNWNGRNFINLGNGVIGADHNYSVVNDLREMKVRVDDGAKTTEQNLMKLEAGRFKGFAAQDVTTDIYLTDGRYPDIEKLPHPFVSRDYFLMLSSRFAENKPETAGRLWKEIGRLRTECEKKLILKYSRQAGKQ